MAAATAEAEEDREVSTLPCDRKAKVRDGAPDFDDLEHIYALYGPRVYYLCLRMTRNPDDAEDLLQETFLRLIQKLDSYRGESAFYTWLRRLAINVTLLRFEKASWQRETSLEAMTDPDPFFTCHPRREFAAVDPELAGAIDRINLERAIEQLSPGFRTVFVLHDIEGYEHNEISRRMGCSVGTSKSQLHKARLKLRQYLGESSVENAAPNKDGNDVEIGEKRSWPDEKEHRVLHFPNPRPLKYETPLSRSA
jgi:RNA polymerase sigma-70 factor (ECF subfamily)